MAWDRTWISTVRGQQPATLGMAWHNSSVHCLPFMWCYDSVVFLLLSAYLSFYTDAWEFMLSTQISISILCIILF